ncbi:MAG: DNA-processing protein DprA [Clostridia bacterium]|nr:DNA-processing protein DprA [Clostridia bacterium]
MNELIYWIWLSLAVTPDTTSFKRLIEAFPDAKAIYEAEAYEISKYIGSRSSDRARLIDKDLSRATEIYNYCVKHEIGIVAYPDENFPVSLREIKTPPVLLYYRGTFPDFNKQFSLSIVGTRTLSDYGRQSAFRAAYDLSLAGAIIVSGMAMGIDGVAHAGALHAGGITVAVIGSGINICYPEDHKTLARAIVKQGCVISEFAPSTPPSRITFPKRNRIISGLSAATLVIEGRERSGSLITARHAREQGRAVYALPGNVGARNSEATNLLIKNGAKLYTAAEDIIKDFENVYTGALNPFKLPRELKADIKEVLTKYSVIAVAPGDDIFIDPAARQKKELSGQLGLGISDKAKEVSTEPTVVSEPPDSFDKNAIKVYKKIPASGSVLIEELVDSEISMRVLMQSLLRLEMGGFVEMCPGELVKRKSK